MKTSISNPLHRVAVSFAIVWFWLAGVAPIWAQEAPKEPSSPQAPAFKVGTITVKFVGTANVNEQIVRANMQVREGGDLDQTMLDRDIKSLYRTGLFEFINVNQEPGDSPNTLNLVVEVTPKYRVFAVRFEGNKKVKTVRLEKEVKTRPNLALDERQVKDDSEKIREYYQKTGYNQVLITYAIERDRVGGFGTVVFKVQEGEKVKIRDIRFVGNAHIKSGRLKGVMETKKWWFLSWLTGSGRLKDEEFEDDLDKLRDFYREQGYLDIEIPQEKIVFNYPKPSKLVLTIEVREGPQYHVGDVTFVGNKLYTSRLLGRVTRQRKGAVFAPSKLDKDNERVTDFYGKDGYLDANVRLLRKPNVNTGNIDIEYQITENEKFNVESIVIEGNSKSKSTVILRELVLGPGDVFDTVRMKVSKLRLDNTRFFEDVNVTSQETNIPGRRNMRIAVKEGRTGNLQFGAGFNSVERATIFAEVSQGNFDLFNRRSGFQGDGQKFRIRLQLGSQSSEAVVSFEEPWLFQQRLALGFSVFRSSSDYNSSFYTQIETGGEVYLRKNLFEQFEGKLSYTYEIVDIKDVAIGASTTISSLQGSSTLSKVGFQLLRDTRDKIVNSTSGNRVEINTAVAGGPFGGSIDYYSLEFRGAQFFPVFEKQTQVLGILGRAGVIENFGDSTDVPYYNKFYLGGPYDLRGFDYRAVSPRDIAGEPVGGKTYAFFSAEYSMDIVSPIRVAFFYDAGFVNKNAYDFNPANYHDNFGIGLRLFVAGAPLSLDFGIPLTSSKASGSGNQFNFSFGTRF